MFCFVLLAIFRNVLLRTSNHFQDDLCYFIVIRIHDILYKRATLTDMISQQL